MLCLFGLFLFVFFFCLFCLFFCLFLFLFVFLFFVFVFFFLLIYLFPTGDFQLEAFVMERAVHNEAVAVVYRFVLLGTSSTSLLQQTKLHQ